MTALPKTERFPRPPRLSPLSEASQDPIPAGRLVLAVVALPGEAKPLGLEFLLPPDALVEAIRRIRLGFSVE